jgi:thiamine biosynthesis lipoprotein
MGMKKKTVMLIIGLSIMLSSGCQSRYNKYSESFFDTFDTMTQVVGYTETEEAFNAYIDEIRQRFGELHMLYDKYNNYDGINNIKSINDHAGIRPVKVEKEIIDLILFAKDWHQRTNGKTNVAMGAVLEIWHNYRDEANYDPVNAKIPPMEELAEAAKHMDMDKVIVDVENSTVYLSDEKMSLDVGAVAQGYATEIVAKEIMEKGFKSGIISAGGNIRVLGKPLDGIRERWGVGIQSPDRAVVSDEENMLDTIFLNNASVVSSGDYQRYYIVDGKVVHHLIDPSTLMPAAYYRAVTVVSENSGVADALSTAIFLMPLPESKALVESLGGTEAIWVMNDGKVEATEGMKTIMKSHGATGAKAK